MGPLLLVSRSDLSSDADGREGDSEMNKQPFMFGNIMRISLAAGLLWFCCAGCAQNDSMVYKVGSPSVNRVSYPPVSLADRSRYIDTAEGPNNSWRSGGAGNFSSNDRQNSQGVSQQRWLGGSGSTTFRSPGDGGYGSYHIGVGDLVQISINQLLEPDRQEVLVCEVDHMGNVYLPVLSEVPASGMTPQQLQEQLIGRLAQQFIRNPQVDVSMKDCRSKKVLVLGNVRRPGPVALQTDVTSLLKVIGSAGGIGNDSAPDIEILRGAYGPSGAAGGSDLSGSAYQRELVPISTLFAEDGVRVDPVIYPGDVVKVQTGTDGYVYLSGEVTQPGAKPFRRPLSILQAVSTAGGLTKNAKDKECKIIRLDANGEEKVIIVDLPKVHKGQERNFILARNDTIIVPIDPVKKFFNDLDSLFKRGIATGVRLQYDAGSEMGIPSSGGGF